MSGYRIVYTGSFPDGSELMVETWVDEADVVLSVTAATKPPRQPDDWSIRCWGPPITLELE